MVPSHVVRFHPPTWQSGGHVWSSDSLFSESVHFKMARIENWILFVEKIKYNIDVGTSFTRGQVLPKRLAVRHGVRTCC